MPNTQVLRGAPASVSVKLLDQHGQPRAAGATTVTITRADGTVVRADAATTDGTLGEKVVSLTSAETADLDRLTATWSEAGGATATTVIEVVGGYYFTLDEARASGPGLSDVAKYPDALVIAARRTVEEECEHITGRAFVPRFKRLTLNGGDRSSLWLPDPDLRALRALTVRDHNGVLLNFDSFSLASLTFDAAGRVSMPYSSFLYGRDNIDIAYEFGLDATPQQIKTAALMRVREVLKFTKAGAPDASTYEIVEGRVFGVMRPGVRGSKTGSPEVDAIYDEWTFRRGSAASVPYGR